MDEKRFTLQEFNHLPKNDMASVLHEVCSSNKWVDTLLEQAPFQDESHLEHLAEETWNTLPNKEWLDAFKGHPKIGQKAVTLEHSHFSPKEQSGLATATDEELAELLRLNDLYHQKFGFIFLISAAGKSAAEIISSLKERLELTAEEEFATAAKENLHITQSRLRKLL